jgi:molybdenum cofactor synthesis domain-containing protein
VYHQTVVGDNPKRLMKALQDAFVESDLVITSGGLGPTYDDLTKETVAEYFGRRLVFHEESFERCRAYFLCTHRKMPDNNTKQAMLPEGAIVFPNDYGTAPAVAVEDEETGKTVIMLPGPPRELEPIFRERVAPYLRARSSEVFLSKNIHLFGIGESQAEVYVRTLMEESRNPTLAPYCEAGEVRFRVTARAKSEAAAECGIRIDASYGEMQPINVSHIDIAVILGNAIDNATEYLQSASIEPKVVNVFARVDSNMIIIAVKNKVEKEIDVSNLISKKNDGRVHGLGILSMQQLAKKHGGEVLLTCEDLTFETHIILHNSGN